MSDDFGWGWVIGGALALLAGTAAGWGVYEHNRYNEEKKKRQDTEYDWQKEKNTWQEEKAELIQTIQTQTDKFEKSQDMVDHLLAEFEKNNPNCTPDDITEMRDLFGIFADDGAKIFTTVKRKDGVEIFPTVTHRNEYLLRNETIQAAIKICSALQDAPQIKQDSFKKFQIDSLKQRLSFRLEQRERQKKATEQWQQIVDSYKNDIPIQAIPKYQNKGGFICLIEENRMAFMPKSHAPTNCIIDHPIAVLILEADDDSRKVIISARKLKEKIDFDAFIKNNPIGTKISGKIVHILGEECHAALISLGDDDICGYLPKGNVIGHSLRIGGFFTIGQTIDVYIKNIDASTKRILLSMYKPATQKSKDKIRCKHYGRKNNKKLWRNV